MKLKKNDKVLVISGKDRGKTGRITRVIAKHNRVVVEKVNMRTKHIKKTEGRPGEKITFEAPMSASNVMILDPKQNKPTRIGYKIVNGKKERISKLTGASLDTAAPAVKEEEKAPKAKAASKKKTIKA